MIASLKTVPPRMLRMVPFGDFHIFFNLNSVPWQSEWRGQGVLHHCVCRCLRICRLTFHPLLIRSDGCTLNANIVLCNGFSTLHSHCSGTGRGRGEREWGGRGREGEEKGGRGERG